MIEFIVIGMLAVAGGCIFFAVRSFRQKRIWKAILFIIIAIALLFALLLPALAR